MKMTNPLQFTMRTGQVALLAALSMATPLAAQPLHTPGVDGEWAQQMREWSRQMREWATTHVRQHVAAAQAPAPPAAPAAPAPPAPPDLAALKMFSSSGSFLGVGVAEVDGERARALKLPEERGVEITKVEPDSPAARAGLKPGDVVQDYQGQRVEGTEQFIRLVRETPPGRAVKMTVIRGGAPRTLTATIEKRKGLAQREWAVHVSPPRVKVDAPHVWMPDIPRPNMSWRSGMLGIEAESVEAQLAQFFGVKEGVLVRSVVKDSPAEKAGIRAGDVIVKVDTKQVASPRELTSALRSKSTGRNFTLTLVREKKEMDLPVKLDDDKSGGVIMAENEIEL